MKHFILLSVIFASAIFLCGCSEDGLSSPSDLQKTDAAVRSLSEGLDDANIAFGKMFETSTRSATRRVGTVECIGRGTRSSETPAYYIVNYANDEGFVILSTDRRKESVFAISDKGSLHLSDTIVNKGLAWYIKDIESLNDNTVNPNNKISLDTVPAVLPTDKFTIVALPLLGDLTIPPGLFDFHQRAPYNKYCFTPTGKQSVVGCAPLAAGTLMAYYKWPLSYKGLAFNWTAMITDRNSDLWPRLFSIIGNSDNMNTSYSENSAGSSPGLYVSTFRNMGYKNMSLSAFNLKDASEELGQGKPLFTRGSATSSGHAWIVDGCQYKESGVAVENPKPRTYYFHCVWGWKGQNNGYFLFANDRVSVSGTTYQGLQYISNLQPNK